MDCSLDPTPFASFLAPPRVGIDHPVPSGLCDVLYNSSVALLSNDIHDLDNYIHWFLSQAMSYAAYVYDIRHVIIDNLQFMTGGVK